MKKIFLIICILIGGLVLLVPDVEKDSELFPAAGMNSIFARSKSFRQLQATASQSMGSVRVMTRNIYLGSSLDPVFGAESMDDVPALMADVYSSLMATRVEERVIAMVNEMTDVKPHVIALQEVYEIARQSPGDSLDGNADMATDVVYNYYDLFWRQFLTLQTSGLSWGGWLPVKNFEIELPMRTGNGTPGYDDIRITNYNYILIANGVAISNQYKKNYDTQYSLDHLGITFTRGFMAWNVIVDEQEFCLVNTNLEPGTTPGQLAVRQAQADELLAFINQQSVPVILAGHFNSSAPNGAVYQKILNGGCTDIWGINSLSMDPDGFTHGHDPDLRNDVPNFTRRVDCIFLGSGWHSGLLGPVFGYVTGRNPNNRTASGLWPSDHGGVVAWIFFYKNM